MGRIFGKLKKNRLFPTTDSKIIDRQMLADAFYSGATAKEICLDLGISQVTLMYEWEELGLRKDSRFITPIEEQPKAPKLSIPLLYCENCPCQLIRPILHNAQGQPIENNLQHLERLFDNEGKIYGKYTRRTCNAHNCDKPNLKREPLRIRKEDQRLCVCGCMKRYHSVSGRCNRCECGQYVVDIAVNYSQPYVPKNQKMIK